MNLPPLSGALIDHLVDNARKPELKWHDAHKEESRMAHAYECGKYDFIQQLARRMKRDKEDQDG